MRHFLNLKIFLWWPNRDLTKKMEEYQMVKYLFGATSSTSVANCCLKKTEQMNHEGFDAKVKATVKRKIYVDVMMKLASAREKAVSLVSQLRRPLKKGGFRIKK